MDFAIVTVRHSKQLPLRVSFWLLALTGITEVPGRVSRKYSTGGAIACGHGLVVPRFFTHYFLWDALVST